VEGLTEATSNVGNGTFVACLGAWPHIVMTAIKGPNRAHFIRSPEEADLAFVIRASILA
jgi:hypothetical protein